MMIVMPTGIVSPSQKGIRTRPRTGKLLDLSATPGKQLIGLLTADGLEPRGSLWKAADRKAIIECVRPE